MFISICCIFYFIINKGNASAKDIYNLIKILSCDFKNKYNVELETEIKYLGEFNEINR